MVNIYNEGETIKCFDGTNIPKMKIINNSVYKVIETDKSSVGKSGIPFMEPIVMEYARRMGLPAPLVTDLFVQNGQYIFATKLLDYVSGKKLLETYPNIKEDLLQLAEQLRQKYENCGLVRKMDLKDMLFKIENGEIKDIIPVDFERLKYNEKLNWNLIFQICEEWNIDLPQQYIEIGKRNKIVF
ncbi:MAG: hypothetical protein J5892_04265 [Bacilli bacterium]|nr:hypothetical protein [Bacilli bacterium]